MQRSMIGLAFLLAGLGCRKDLTSADLDGDGYTAAEGDCGPGDPASFPGAPEVCDGHDNNCDTNIDDGAGTPWFADVDGDGFGDDTSETVACLPPAGTTSNGGDCDDNDVRVNPAAVESCEVTVDVNCDGATSGDDADEDGFVACNDCDDTDPDVNPDADEVCGGGDENCDGAIDEDGAADATEFCVDLDGDGAGSDRLVATSCEAPQGFVTDADDCDDLHAQSFPNAPELCDGLDNDCNGTLDDGATGTVLYWADTDKDGYGDPNAEVDACARPAGYTDNYDDCNDADAAYNPGASESCSDPNDYNCDGSVGQADGDLDGTPACTDCDDTNKDVHPGAPEICDSLDNDCNGQTDETAPTWYADVDGDGHGGTQLSTVSCAAPGGFVASQDDCDDLRPSVFPGATEACDGLDGDCAGGPDANEADADGDRWRGCEGDCDDANNAAHPGGVELCDAADNDCDSAVDELAADAIPAYTDADLDGFGVGTATYTCAVGAGQAAVAGDCDDTSNAVRPGATEACNTKDDDCDGSIDETGATGSTAYYLDADGDGVGGTKVTVSTCAAPAGYVSTNTDCDDTDARAYPAATEVCDGVDNNCDKASLTGEADGDKDNWRACAGDCNDANAKVNPGVTEVCNAVDDDCDTFVDTNAVDAGTWYADVDKDAFGAGAAKIACSAPAGYVALAGDCDDNAVTSHPGASELCNAKDDDCDTKLDNDPVDTTRWFADADGDKFGAAATSKLACAQPSGYVAIAGDCDDTKATSSPVAPELCSTPADDDCDGIANEADAQDAVEWFQDRDSDTHGSPYDFTIACTNPGGRAAVADDCNDSVATIYAGATEKWYDGIDQNCDGRNDFDQDGDGYTNAKYAGGTDCDDTKASVLACNANCASILAANASAASGPYLIDPNGDGMPLETWCDMTRNGGGWTLVVQNNTGVSSAGRGNLGWAESTGTDSIVRGGTMTSWAGQGAFDLWVGLASWNAIGSRARIEVGGSVNSPTHQAMADISIGDASTNYTLNLTNGSVTVGAGLPDIINYHSGMPFTTYDRDNDSYSTNCSTLYQHPWWYGSCWAGSFWGSDIGGYQPSPYWTSSGADYYTWGAIWIR